MLGTTIDRPTEAPRGVEVIHIAGVQGQRPAGVQGAAPLVGGPGGEAPENLAFLSILVHG